MVMYLRGMSPDMVATDEQGDVMPGEIGTIHTSVGGPAYTNTFACDTTTLAVGAATGGTVTADNIGRFAFYTENFSGTLWMNATGKWWIVEASKTSDIVSGEVAAAIAPFEAQVNDAVATADAAQASVIVMDTRVDTAEADIAALETKTVGLDDAEAGKIHFGPQALATLVAAGYNVGVNSLFAAGYHSAQLMTEGQGSVAIGREALGNTIKSHENIAIGPLALRNVQSVNAAYDQANQQGTRNVAIGGNSALFVNQGYGVVAIGRNAWSGATAGQGGVAIGQGACGGYAPVGLSGEIENYAAWGADGTMNRTTGVGTNALARVMNASAVAVGGEALANLKKSANNTAVGARALASLEAGAGPGGGVWTVKDIAGTYSQTANSLVLTFTAHGVLVGEKAQFRLLDGGSATFQFDQVQATATAVTANTITVTHPISRTASGTAHLYGKETTTAVTTNGQNTVMGTSAAAEMTTGSNNTVVGEFAGGTATTMTNATVFGRRALQLATSATDVTAVGHNALGSAGGAHAGVTGVGSGCIASGSDSTVIGSLAQSAAHTNCTALGRGATCQGTNSTALGYGAVANAANKVRIGNSSVTVIEGQVTWTFPSDERDKTDIRDTQLGLEFVEQLRPVDYRYLPRDTGQLDPTLRHGFIAQEIDQIDAEFGGLHTENPDQMTLAVTEMIGPLVKAVQELSTRLAAAEQRIAELEG